MTQYGTVSIGEKMNLEGIVSPHYFDVSWGNFERRVMERLKGQFEVSGAELMVISLEALRPENLGVQHTAGHHGGAILPFYEYFTKSGLWNGYTHSPNEQIAGFIQEGLADVTGSVAIDVATSGPGATNSITAFYDSRMDSIRKLTITGNVSQAVAGSMAFQEAPIIEMVKPVAKGTYYVTDTRDIPRVIYEAFYFAATGRPGPVWVDFPKSTQLNRIYPSEINLNFIQPEINVDNLEDIIKKSEILAWKIKGSERPILYVGGGVKSARAWSELREIVYKLGIPVTTTLKGKGVFPETDKLSLGMLGMHGTAYANYAIEEADLIINIGARYDDRVTGNYREWCKDAYHAHIDIDPRGIGAKGIRQPDLTIKADIKQALQIFNGVIDRYFDREPNFNGWYNAIEFLKQEFPLDYDGRSKLIRAETKCRKFVNSLKSSLPSFCFSLPKYFKESNERPIYPEYVIEMIYRETDGKHLIATDVGQHQMWTAQYYLMNDPIGFQTSGGAGTMGCSMAKALGAYIGLRQKNNDKPVSVIVGDESFMMNPQVLALYRRLKSEIKVFVIDNKSLEGTPGGMVSQWYRRVHNNTEHPVNDDRDIARIARGFGIRSVDVYRVKDVIPAIRKALGTNGPFVVNFRVNPYEDCLPMYPSGGTIEQMITFQNQRPDLEGYLKLKDILKSIYSQK